MEYSFTNVWLPLGFSYWEQGNWQSTGTNTSMTPPSPNPGTNDYLNVALPKSGKWYWETKLESIASAQVIGIGVGASGAGTAYLDDLIGYYYNGPIPLFLCKTGAGNHQDAVDHGTSTGTEWVVGKKLMWAYVPGDAPDTGKVWLGYDGTWYGSGDPAAGTNPSISGADLSPANSGTNYYLKIGYSDGGGPIVLENVSGTSTTHTISGVVDMEIASTTFQPATATPFVSPTYAAVTRATANATLETISGINLLDRAVRWPLQGRRPTYGLKYPRGNYNK